MIKRIRAIPGGTGASKTFSVVIYLVDLALTDKKPTLTSIVSESFPHLKRGAMRDFLMIMKGLGLYQDKQWNKTDSFYTFDTDSKIEFFSVDQADKVRGARRDRLFINEANNVSFDSFEQLEVRTKDFIFLDWNPSSEFWYYTELKGKRSDVEEITLTYKDNEALSQEIIDSIEQRRNRVGWWQVYGEGILGEIEGKIYKDWKIVDEIPHEARLERYGLNFGYTNHPAALVAIYYYNGGYIIEEILYGRGISNQNIADILINRPKALLIADSAEPKSIDELKSYQLNVMPALKGKDSVRFGIETVQEQRISLTKGSVNVIKEYRNYLWLVDKNGKVLNEPDEPYHYSMDAVRYSICSLVPIIRRNDYIKSLPRYQTIPKLNPAR